MSVYSVDISDDDREIIIKALKFKLAAVVRAIRGESNPEIRAIRSDEADAFESLISKFR